MKMREISRAMDKKPWDNNESSMSTALKTVISDIIPDGQEPYGEYKPDEPIEVVFSPLSVVSRMVLDLYNIIYTNKTLLGLKDKIKEML